MIPGLCVLTVTAILAGLAFWCLKVAFLCEVRNDVYRCRERVYDLVIDGKATLEEEPVREFTQFLHNIINALDDFSLVEFAIAFARSRDQRKDRISFIDDERLRPIAIEACDAVIMGLIHSSILLKFAVMLLYLFGWVYKPIQRYTEWRREQAVNLLLHGAIKA
ncbi:MAG: hypothetical protein ABSE73_20050 [Planctomycetota bacterium]